jgi:putative phosphoribosyl transferase
LADGSLDERYEQTRRGARQREERMKPRYFRDRSEAGRLLAAKLRSYANRSDVIVLALPRGGVPVVHEAASALRAPMDVFLVRKLGVPGYEQRSAAKFARRPTKAAF